MAPTSPSTAARARARYASDGTGGTPTGRTVVLLYQRLERDIDEAEAALTSRDVEGAHRTLMHAQEIVMALDLALDHNAWDGAEDLSRLYRFVRDRLIEANVRKDPTPLAGCRAVIGPLSSAWQQSWASTAASAS